ncbi:hypothetical protein [Caballeronia sp. J97]|uniref:hypothetical protein n=1 Tax=Caballeronia sp. J97 TaxID=2805429 RepID=UPI002AB02D75|nr:hypothetical protein [Caballeronia sp. J97]
MVRKNKTPRLRSRIIGFSLFALSTAMLSACGGGSDSGGDPVQNNGTAPDGGNGGNTPSVAHADVSGKLTYDFVPTSTTENDDGTVGAKLDYTKIEHKPVRHAFVEVLSEDGTKVLGNTYSDDNGAYSISVPVATRVYVRVSATAAESPDNASGYSLSIRDNSSMMYAIAPGLASIYSMRSSAFSNEGAGTKVDLNAASGWTGNGYGQTRAAAPFAILDEIVTAAQKMRATATDVPLPALNVFWSIDNRPTAGDQSKGFINTSHYEGAGAGKGLYILGAENVDTDEYDASVVVHEFGHYVEANLSRSDNIGGPHGLGNALDMRVAFGEAWGNAFSSMMRGTPVYTDTVGSQQSQTGVAMRLDQVSATDVKAWFNEAAVGNFLYSLNASPDIGFEPIYRAMRNGEKVTPALTSVFSFATALRPTLSDAGKTELDAMLTQLGVPGGPQLDEWGTSMMPPQNSNPNIPAIYPIYVPLKPDTSATSCTTTAFGAGNKLGNFGHARLTVPAAGRYKLTLGALQDGVSPENYRVSVYLAGKEIAAASATDSEYTYRLDSAGDYSADILPTANADESTAQSATPSCISVSLQRVN